MINFDNYLSGDSLYGDDFSFEQIQKWYEQEAEAYADLYGVDASEEKYVHHMDILYGYNYLKHIPTIECALGFGSSWGFEFLPIIHKINELHIIDSSKQTVAKKLGNLIPVYHIANVSGEINFPDNSFDHINALSVLHHIPNVTFVLNELFRVLKPGGYILLKEPVTSMGDWRTKRTGLTVNERGIPPAYFEKIITDAGMKIISKHYWGTMLSFLMRIIHSKTFFTGKFYFVVDRYLSKCFVFNMHYHPVKKMQRICPQYVFYVLRKK